MKMIVIVVLGLFLAVVIYGYDQEAKKHLNEIIKLRKENNALIHQVQGERDKASAITQELYLQLQECKDTQQDGIIIDSHVFNRDPVLL